MEDVLEIPQLRKLIENRSEDGETEVVSMKSSERGRNLLIESKKLQQNNQSPMAIFQVHFSKIWWQEMSGQRRTKFNLALA